MRRTHSRIISVLVLLAMVCSMLAVPVSALSWDNVSETRYASRYTTSDYATGKFYDNLTSIPLTGDGARDVVAVAASQVGYIEGDNANGYDGETGGSTNYTEYGYYMGLSGGSSHAWCAAFCAWCFYAAEVTDVDGYYYDTGSGNIWADTYVPDWSNYLINQGRYKAAYQFRNSYSYLYDASYVPQPGDLVFFYTSSEDYPGWEGHIGLVAYSDGTYVYTLEGNTSSQDGVESEGGGAFLKKYSLTSSSLVGFGDMPYETVSGLPEIDYTGANPTPGLYVTTSGAKSVYQNIDDTTASWTLPMSSVFEVLEIANDSDGNVMLYSKCEINGSTVYGWIAHGSDYNGYTKTLQIYASSELEIPESYGPSQDEEGNYSFENAYGYTFKINDVDGVIDGEDATLITTASAYESCNPNWAISVQLRPTGNANEYSVVKVVETPGSAADAGISLASGDVILVVHSAGSKPGYANWMSKVAAVALKEGDILTFDSSNTSATVVSAGDPLDPTDPEPTDPTEPDPTDPEPEVTVPSVDIPDYGGAIPGAGLQGSADNLYYGCDLSFYNVSDSAYANCISNDDSGADYSLVDFERMKADGCDFVILRMGSSDSSGYYTDPHFFTFYDMARAAGMDIGLYFYSYALSEREAIAEANYVISVLDSYDMYFEYPIYIDIEESDQLALGETALSNVCYGWCETLADAGYFPGIYGNYNLYDNISAQVKADYDFWLAYVSSATSASAYNPSNTNLSAECSVWQYSFYGYEYDGIGLSMLDVNVSYKDYPAIMKAYGYNNIAQETTKIPGSYGASIDEDGNYSFENAYGYVFEIDDVNGTIEGEDATLITTASAYESCNPNWAISVQLRPVDNGEYEVVKVVSTPGSAAAAGITMEDGDVVMVVHSAGSKPGYSNWMSKVAAVALKEGDIVEIASDNTTVTVIGPGETEEPIEPAPAEPVYSITYTQASVSTAGDIGLNFYATMSEDLMADEGAYLIFTVAGEEQIVPVSDALVTTGSDGTKAYRFSAKVSARQMADQVVAQMYTSDGTAVGDPKAYSVKAYCEQAIPYFSGYTAYADLVNLMKAMLNYGAYSQIKFGYNTENLANAGIETDPLPDITAADLAAYSYGKEGSEDGISIYSVSLLLQSTTTIRFYFQLDGDKTIEDYTFEVDGEIVEPVHYSDKCYYVDKVGIAAKDLDVNSYVTVGGLTVWYNGMSYVLQVLSSSTDADLINVCKALYAYSQAANAYFVVENTPSEPEVSEPEVSEPEVSEPEVSEPEIETVTVYGNLTYANGWDWSDSLCYQKQIFVYASTSSSATPATILGQDVGFLQWQNGIVFEYNEENGTWKVIVADFEADGVNEAESTTLGSNRFAVIFHDEAVVGQEESFNFFKTYAAVDAEFALNCGVSTLQSASGAISDVTLSYTYVGEETPSEPEQEPEEENTPVDTTVGTIQSTIGLYTSQSYPSASSGDTDGLSAVLYAPQSSTVGISTYVNLAAINTSLYTSSDALAKQNSGSGIASDKNIDNAYLYLCLNSTNWSGDFGLIKRLGDEDWEIVTSEYKDSAWRWNAYAHSSDVTVTYNPDYIYTKWNVMDGLNAYYIKNSNSVKDLQMNLVYNNGTLTYSLCIGGVTIFSVSDTGSISNGKYGRAASITNSSTTSYGSSNYLYQLSGTLNGRTPAALTNVQFYDSYYYTTSGYNKLTLSTGSLWLYPCASSSAGYLVNTEGDPIVTCEEVTLTSGVVMDIINIQNY